MNSGIVPNPLYVNVVCGQALAEPKKGKIGDNTGDNISDRAPYYSEYSVQYWAWKNVKADYYGLCHYRRYLSFAEEFFPEGNDQRFAIEAIMKRRTLARYGLLKPRLMAKEIKKYDVITSVTYNVSQIPNVPPFKNVYEAIVKSPALFTSEESVKKLINIVQEDFPEYYESLNEVLNSEWHRGFNCFVMKKELFHLMCEFEFGVLFKIEKTLKLDNRVGFHQRELGYLGEILYGTFLQWVSKQGCYRIKETQIVLYRDTETNMNMSRIRRIAQNIARFFNSHHRTSRMAKALQDQKKSLYVLDRTLKQVSNKIDQLSQKNNSLFFSVPREFSHDMDAVKWSFWKSFPKASGDLRIIQEANATLLKNFQIICDKLECQFWLHGGSLIGGLRHSGYVPWDDDIDIAMMRADFLKIKKFLEDNSPLYEIKEYYYIRVLGCRSYRFRRKDMMSNCFVDIFVYDNYSLRYDDKLTDWKNLCFQKKRIRRQCIDLYKELCSNLPIPPKDNTPLIGYDDMKKALDILFDTYIEHNTSDSSSEFILWNLDNNYENETRYAWHHGRIFKKSDIFPLKTCSYEGMEVCIPANYEKYAMAEYGIGYLDIPNNMGTAVHWQQYFSGEGQIDMAKEIISQGITEA